MQTKTLAVVYQEIDRISGFAVAVRYRLGKIVQNFRTKGSDLYEHSADIVKYITRQTGVGKTEQYRAAQFYTACPLNMEQVSKYTLGWSLVFDLVVNGGFDKGTLVSVLDALESLPFTDRIAHKNFPEIRKAIMNRKNYGMESEITGPLLKAAVDALVKESVEAAKAKEADSKVEDPESLLSAVNASGNPEKSAEEEAAEQAALVSAFTKARELLALVIGCEVPESAAEFTVWAQTQITDLQATESVAKAA